MASAPSPRRSIGKRVSGAANHKARPKHKRSNTASQKPVFELQPEMNAKMDPGDERKNGPGSEDTPRPHDEDEECYREGKHDKHDIQPMPEPNPALEAAGTYALWSGRATTMLDG